jgi:hypothetical protein
MMVLALLVSGCLLATEPNDSPAPLNEDQAYQDAKARAGHNPDSQVQLALWCESHGMTAERAAHLARALLADPKSVLAQGLLGLVNYHDQWLRPEIVAEKIRADEHLAAALAEYNAKRDKTPNTAEAQWDLALWCEQKGLKPEAIAHFTVVTRLAPNRASAWNHLGYRSHGGRWMTDEQIAAAKAEAEAQKKADSYWEPRLQKWERNLAGPDWQRAEAEQNLAAVTDPRAVPAIWRHMGHGRPEQQALAAQLLNQINAPVATRRIAALAVFSNSREVSRQAADLLRRRDPREYLGPMIDCLKKPLRYEERTLSDLTNATTELIVEGEQFILKRYYVLNRSRAGSSSRSEARDVGAIARHNAFVSHTNYRITELLHDLTGEYHGRDPEAWKAWWQEQQGYGRPYVTNGPAVKRTVVQTVYVRSLGHKSCFGAGTLVRTNDGTRPIEELKVGDVVLVQDTKSGALSFQPVVVVYHNPPARTVKVDLEGEAIIATGIHRFWKAGAGWAMARDLKPGDTVRTLDGLAKVVSVAEGLEQPVFNLEVAEGHSFFVGQRAVLVHDNRMVESTSDPFDAVRGLASIGAVVLAH